MMRRPTFRRGLKPGEEYYEPHRRFGICMNGGCRACVRIFDPLNILPQPQEIGSPHLCEIGPHAPCYD